MKENNHDQNPGRYLVVYGDDPKFLSSLRDLDKTDSAIGDTNSAISNTLMVQYLNTLVSQKEDEIQDRICQIQERDKQIQLLIDEIHRIYSSKRYKVGHLAISPVESIISRIKRK